jgi:DNA-directed RNA polymerase specialized sigma24 family protein
VAKPAVPGSELKKDWVLTQRAFRDLLYWLDEGSDSAGEKYLEMRRRLVVYFDRKNCASPDDLADETLNRVARRLEEEGAITDTAPARYCYIAAKFVFLEHLRRIERRQVSLENVSIKETGAGLTVTPRIELDESEELIARRFDCLHRCLQHLAPENREILLEYYQGEQRVKIENRRALATRLGVTMNALSIRTCRLRNALEECVRKCVGR